MRILMLARKAGLYSHKRIVEAAEERGHEIRVIDTLRCYMNITAHRPEVRFRGEKITGYDAVIPRIGQSITFYGLAVLRQFEMMGVYPLNESVAIGRSRDKLRALQILSREGVGLPVTGFAHSPDDTNDVIGIAGGAPLVIKLLEGTHGKGVVLADTRSAATGIIQSFKALDAHFMAQEFIKEASGSDIRAFVIGERIIAAMMRTGEEGEFRSNIHLGGKAEPIRVTPEERSTAVRAARSLGLNVAGVDILRSNHGPVVMEVNSSPGLQGIESATQIDVAGKIIEFIEKNAKPRKTRTRGKG